jgi:hypothetical protein
LRVNGIRVNGLGIDVYAKKIRDRSAAPERFQRPFIDLPHCLSTDREAVELTLSDSKFRLNIGVSSLVRRMKNACSAAGFGGGGEGGIRTRG